MRRAKANTDPLAPERIRGLDEQTMAVVVQSWTKALLHNVELMLAEHRGEITRDVMLALWFPAPTEEQLLELMPLAELPDMAGRAASSPKRNGRAAPAANRG